MPAVACGAHAIVRPCKHCRIARSLRAPHCCSLLSRTLLNRCVLNVSRNVELIATHDVRRDSFRRTVDARAIARYTLRLQHHRDAGLQN